MQPHIGGAADATAWREELERVLASASFAGASRMRALLCYLMRETMAGRGERLKEYTVGQEVFGRTKDFDPRIDTLVRTEAWRLRARLAQYYVGEGAGNPLRIELPDEAVPRNMFSFDLHGRVGLVPGVFLEGAMQYLKNPNASLAQFTTQRTRDGWMFNVMLVADLGMISDLSRPAGPSIEPRREGHPHATDTSPGASR
jgi:hypothetical protein